ncbi:MAG: ribonuclease J [Alphaproteobacteria bacterium]
MKFKEDSVYFLPLGGSGEIGMNLNLYGYKNRWLMVDCGITFHDRVGVEVLMPNISFLQDKLDKLEAIVLTHAHEDHIGALPYLWEKLGKPQLYATPFTIEMIRKKMKETGLDFESSLNVIPLKASQKIGDFEIEMVTLTHSIPEPSGIILRTPVGNIFHTGDWKIDHAPLIGKPIQDQELRKIGDQGILAMISDSTNVFHEGDSGSEETVRDNLDTLIGSYTKGAVFVTCFASNVARLQSIALAGQKHGRKVVLLGRGFHNINEISQKFGYLKNVGQFTEARAAGSIARQKVLYICSGSQGESRAALSRISSGTHPDVKMKEGDVVIFSSRIIPGNEKSINNLKSKIIKLGVNVIFKHSEDIHVSGHPSRNDLVKMYEWIRPQTLIPVHGELIHMVEQGKLGKKQGIPNIVIPENGTIVEITKTGATIIDEVPTGKLALDGTQLLSFNDPIFRTRHYLGNDGVLSLSLLLNEENELHEEPDIKKLGLSFDEKTGKDLESLTLDAFESLSVPQRNDDGNIENTLKKSLVNFLDRKISKKPLVVVHIIRL